MSKGGSSGGGGSPAQVTQELQQELATYPNLPETVTYPAFSPNADNALAYQMAKGFGDTPQTHLGRLHDTFGPTESMLLVEPILQTLDAFGVTPNYGSPGEYSGIPSGYKQDGVTTGNRFIDSMLGFKPDGVAIPNSPAHVAAPSANSGGNYTPPAFDPEDYIGWSP